MLSRKLPYPLQDAEYPEQGMSEEDATEMTWSSEDNDERVWIALFLSLNEYVKLASSVDVGRDIAYPEESFNVWWLWQEVYKVANFCAAVAECIENSDAVKTALDSAIASLLSDNDSLTYNAVSSLSQQAARDFYGANLSSERMTQDLVGGTNPTCDLDILYGQCLSICVAVNRAITDGLQKVESASNAGELGIAVAELPLLNLVTRNTGITSVIEIADKAIEFLAEGYLAAYDEAKEIEYACAIFCACQDDCQITIERLFDVFHTIVSEHGTFPIFGNFADWLSWFSSAVISGGIVADVAFFAAFGALKTANFLFFGAADWILDVQIQRAANNPDGDWTFCDCGEGIQVDIYSDFAGSTLVETIYLELETPYELDFDVISPVSQEVRINIITSQGLSYTSTGSEANTGGEISWFYRDPEEVDHFATNTVMSAMPSPTEGYLYFWNAQTSGGKIVFTLHAL